jgi:hypothetical protein
MEQKAGISVVPGGWCQGQKAGISVVGRERSAREKQAKQMEQQKGKMS